MKGEKDLKISILKRVCLFLVFAFVLSFVFSAFVACDHSCDRLGDECAFCEIFQVNKSLSSFTVSLISVIFLLSFLRLVFGKDDGVNRSFDTLVRLKVKLSD